MCFTRNSNRTIYTTSDVAAEYSRWIEEKYNPSLFLHLTFPESTYKKEAEAKLKQFFNRAARLKLIKQHIRWFVWGGQQRLREDGSYHFHIVGCLERDEDPARIQQILSRLKSLWVSRGGGKLSQADRYFTEFAGITYAAMYHPDFWTYVGCPARMRQCRTKKCIYL